MANSNTANDVLRLTVEFFDAGLGAGNLSFGYDSKNPSETDKRLTKDQIARNEKANQVKKVLYLDRLGHADDSPFVDGARRYKAKIKRGNCGEMAAVALYIARKKCHVLEDEVRTATVEGVATKKRLMQKKQSEKFGHSFLIIKDAGEDKWVVDPWAGICCKKSNYADALTQKMNEWHSTNVRLGYQRGKNAVWGTPKDPVIEAFIAQLTSR